MVAILVSAVVFCGFYLEFQELHREKVLFPLKLLVLANQDISSLTSDSVVQEYLNRTLISVGISLQTWFRQYACLNAVFPYRFPKIG